MGTPTARVGKRKRPRRAGGDSPPSDPSPNAWSHVKLANVPWPPLTSEPCPQISMCSFIPPRPKPDPRDERIRKLENSLAAARGHVAESADEIRRYKKRTERLREERDALRRLPPPSPPQSSTTGRDEVERQRIRRAVKQCIRNVHPDKTGNSALDATAVTKMLTALMESV